MPAPKWHITRTLLTNLRRTAKKVHPLEFIGMMGVSARDSFCLSELIVLPAEFGYTHSGLHTELIPFDPLVVGTVHSHPSPSVRASKQDLAAFARLGKIHLILGHPYEESQVAAYSSTGVRIPLTVID